MRCDFCSAEHPDKTREDALEKRDDYFNFKARDSNVLMAVRDRVTYREIKQPAEQDIWFPAVVISSFSPVVINCSYQ